MSIILIILLAGTIAGYLFTRVKGFNKVTDKASLYTIYILLFFMGLSIGNKPEVMKNLAGIGFSAFLIAMFATVGSILVAWIIYQTIFRKDEK